MKLCELRKYKWNEYVTFAVESQFKQLRSSPKKSFSGLQRDSNPWPLRSRCSALPAEPWRPIHWRLANIWSSSTRERNETQNEMTCTAEIQMKWKFDFYSCNRTLSKLVTLVYLINFREDVEQFASKVIASRLQLISLCCHGDKKKFQSVVSCALRSTR